MVSCKETFIKPMIFGLVKNRTSTQYLTKGCLSNLICPTNKTKIVLYHKMNRLTICIAVTIE